MLQFDQAHAQGVHTVVLGHDLIAEGVHHAVVQAPVQGLRILEQLAVDLGRAGAAQDVTVVGLDGVELFLAGGVHEMQDGLALDHGAYLECVADQLQVDMGDVQAALGHGTYQAIGLQARDHLAHGAQRYVEQCHQFALRDELPAADTATQDLLRETLISPRALAHAIGRGGHDRQGRRLRHHFFLLARAHCCTTPFFSKILP